MKSSLVLIVSISILLGGCFGNPLGKKSSQSKDFHPGIPFSHPEIQSVKPGSGGVKGGSRLTIKGKDFQETSKVTMGGVACAELTFVSNTELHCVTPSHIAGKVAMIVTNADEQSGTLQDAFQYFGNDSPTLGFSRSSAGGIATGPGVRLRFKAGGPIRVGAQN